MQQISLRTIHIKGGYDVEAVANSSLAVARTLLGDVPPVMQPLVASAAATETIYQVALRQSKYWKSIDHKGLDPAEGKFFVGCRLPRTDGVISLFRRGRRRHNYTWSVRFCAACFCISTLTPLIELLKAHRTRFMYETYKMHTLPFANESLNESFEGQVLVS
jgi:histone deacetylase 6